MVKEARLLAELGRRIARARLRQNQTQAKLAAAAGVSLSTLRRLESGGGSQLSAFLSVLRTLDLLDELEAAIPASKPSPIELVDSGPQLRRRARGKKSPAQTNQPFEWGDEDA
jgi:transcriptional regulator with XRE-family HTH domain